MKTLSGSSFFKSKIKLHSSGFKETRYGLRLNTQIQIQRKEIQIKIGDTMQITQDRELASTQ